jgi:hypothetical protein
MLSVDIWLSIPIRLIVRTLEADREKSAPWSRQRPGFHFVNNSGYERFATRRKLNQPTRPGSRCINQRLTQDEIERIIL